MANKKLEKRIRLKKKIQAKVFGTKERPRLSVFRSNSYIYAQVIDDTVGKTIVSASDLPVSKKTSPKGKVGPTETKSKKASKTKTGTKSEHSIEIGAIIAKALIAKGIKTVVFDRNGFKYTGRIKALADSARKAGLSF